MVDGSEGVCGRYQPISSVTRHSYASSICARFHLSTVHAHKSTVTFLQLERHCWQSHFGRRRFCHKIQLLPGCSALTTCLQKKRIDCASSLCVFKITMLKPCEGTHARAISVMGNTCTLNCSSLQAAGNDAVSASKIGMAHVAHAF